MNCERKDDEYKALELHILKCLENGVAEGFFEIRIEGQLVKNEKRLVRVTFGTCQQFYVNKINLPTNR